MAKICVIINYLQCHESMDLICDIWKTGIAKAVPKKVCRDLVLCAFIACVCGGPKLFVPAVRPAILEGQTMLPSLGLPFNPGVLGKLPGSKAIHFSMLTSGVEVVEESRQGLIKKTLGSLYDVVDLLTGASAPCHVECSSMLLGSLLKQMDEISLPRTRPTHLDTKWSVGSLIRAIRGFTSPTWSHPSESATGSLMDYETWKKMKGRRVNRSSFSRHSGSRDVVLKHHSCTLKDFFHGLDFFEGSWEVPELC